jgi:hypothetical protein
MALNVEGSLPTLPLPRPLNAESILAGLAPV